MALSKSERYTWADIVRIIAVCLVVILHSFALPLESSPDFFITYIVKSVANFGAPLFLMLSGALLLPKTESISTFFVKRIKKIVVPWLFVTIVIVMLMQESFSVTSFLLNVAHNATAKFTYIPMIFCLYLLIPIFQGIVQQQKLTKTWYIVSLWFLGVSVLPHIRDSLAFPLQVDNGLVRQSIDYSGYLFLGYALTKLQFQNLRLAFSLFIFSASALLLSGQLQYTSPYIVMGSASLFWIFSFLRKNAEQLSFRLKTFIHTLSDLSFGVFLIHAIVLQYLQAYLQGSSLSENLMRSAIVISVSYAIVRLAIFVKLRL